MVLLMVVMMMYRCGFFGVLVRSFLCYSFFTVDRLTCFKFGCFYALLLMFTGAVTD